MFTVLKRVKPTPMVFFFPEQAIPLSLQLDQLHSVLLDGLVDQGSNPLDLGDREGGALLQGEGGESLDELGLQGVGVSGGLFLLHLLADGLGGHVLHLVPVVRLEWNSQKSHRISYTFLSFFTFQ
jgi:hypothetical protein